MNGDRMLQHLLNDYAAERARLTDHIAGGNIATFDEYKNLCGQVRGLLLAEESIHDLLRKLKEQDDD